MHLSVVFFLLSITGAAKDPDAPLGATVCVGVDPRFMDVDDAEAHWQVDSHTVDRKVDFTSTGFKFRDLDDPALLLHPVYQGLLTGSSPLEIIPAGGRKAFSDTTLSVFGTDYDIAGKGFEMMVYDGRYAVWREGIKLFEEKLAKGRPIVVQKVGVTMLRVEHRTFSVGDIGPLIVVATQTTQVVPVKGHLLILDGSSWYHMSVFVDKSEHCVLLEYSTKVPLDVTDAMGNQVVLQPTASWTTYRMFTSKTTIEAETNMTNAAAFNLRLVNCGDLPARTVKMSWIAAVST